MSYKIVLLSISLLILSIFNVNSAPKKSIHFDNAFKATGAALISLVHGWV